MQKLVGKMCKTGTKMVEKCDFGQIRVVERDGESWFVAADVCNVLDLSNPTIAVSRLDEDERAKFNLGRQGDATIVNEPGLYTLVLGSRKPEAKAFKRWITHEVIPIIRKTGAYSTRKPDSYMKYHVNLKARMQSDTHANIKPKLKNKMDLIDRGAGMTAELFEIACKLFENDVDELKKEWDVTCVPHIPQANIACR